MISRAIESRSFPRALVLAVAVLAAVLGCRIVTYGIRLTGLSVAPGAPSLAVGTTQQFTATGAFNDESSRDVTTEVAWSSSDPTVATVDASGVATPLKAGTTTITAALSDRSAASTLTVTNALLSSIEVLPAGPSIPNGTRQRFAATGHFDDGSTQDLTAQAAWTSSDASVTVGDAVGTKGIATSTALGATTSTITATFHSIPGSTTLTVKDVTLSSVAVDPASATIKAGRFQQFAATGTFSDTSTHVMTDEVTWASLDTGIATINATGRAMGGFAGTTTVTATSNALLGSKQGTAELIVQTAGPGY